MRRGLAVLCFYWKARPSHIVGGNSRHTRNFRCMHHGPLGPLTNDYLEDEYFEDLLKVTKGKTDEDLGPEGHCRE